MSSSSSISIGIDFGTDSVRALAVDCTTGAELATDVRYYARWRAGDYCVPAHNQFRQHPQDHIESMTLAVRAVVEQIGSAAAARVIAIGVDTTGSTPAPVDAEGQVLALRPEFADNPNAMFILWKDHTAIAEAEQINALCATDPDAYGYLKGCGGAYSSEWFWSKILHVCKHDAAVVAAAASWVEMADWVPALLTGTAAPAQLRRGRCAAGHKCMWNARWGGLPSRRFFAALHPALAERLPCPLFVDTYTADVPTGTLAAAWADAWGLPPTVVVAGGAIDSHVGAVGAGAAPYVLVKVIGTSTCDMLVADEALVQSSFLKGICGQVDGSIVPGLVGFEAGQSAFGDIFAWYKNLLCWPLRQLRDRPRAAGHGGGPADEAEAAARALWLEEAEQQMLNELAETWRDHMDLERLPLTLDWFNGRRTPNANQRMKGVIAGLTLGSDAPAVFGSLIVATACGARAIAECFTSQQIPIHSVMAIGGIAKKAPVIMQTCADVMGCAIAVSQSEQCCALGGAILGAVAAAAHPSVAVAQQHMASAVARTYVPDAERMEVFKVIYDKYLAWSRVTEPLYSSASEPAQ